MVPRPTFLVAEVEPPEGVSVRKLVLETAKFNVITAHSVEETMLLLQKYPNVDAVIIHSSLHDLDCERIVARIKRQNRKRPVIMLTPSTTFQCKGVDHHISSYEPQELLKLLRSLFGDPRTQDAA